MKIRALELLLGAAYGTPRREAAWPPRKILLIRRNGIGDMICALPLVRRVRAGFPAARIDMLASERNAPILQDLSLVDRVLVYRRGGGLLRNHYFNLRRFMRPVRAERYDLVVAITGAFSKLVAVITHATGVPRRVGFVPARGHALDFCYSEALPQPAVREHQIERCLRLAEPLGIPPVDIDVSFALRPEHERWADEALAAKRLPAPFVLYNASASRPESSWSAAAIADTARALRARHGLATLACGLPSDETLLGSTGLPYALTPSVHQFAALVRRSLFLMCTDGGSMHVAAAMNTPAFVLFASAEPETWRPWGVPFGYVRSGSRVGEISVASVLERLSEWLPALPGELERIGRGERI
jgi:ADP-heptose:LPS heptosyltransferase